jgi:hypothetical protein
MSRTPNRLFRKPAETGTPYLRVALLQNLQLATFNLQHCLFPLSKVRFCFLIYSALAASVVERIG